MSIPVKEIINKKLDYFYASNNITFDGRKHQYKLDGITCAGVSTISDYRPKDYLKFWSAKMVVEFLADKQEIIKKLNKKEYSDLLYEAKNQHAKKSKEATDIGEKAHNWIESYIKGKRLPITRDIENPVNEFLKFEKVHKVEWIAVEKIVCSSTYLVAGRLDALAIVDGKLSLVDLKTSSQIEEGYFLQTAGYQLCLEEMGVKVNQRIILRLPKKRGDEFEPVLVDTEYEEDKKAFLNLRYAWQWACAIDVKHKEDAIVKGYKTRRLKLKKL
jgi:CRISPR/Cas system-associated exonuclease Cas4 (RecB family)